MPSGESTKVAFHVVRLKVMAGERQRETLSRLSRVILKKQIGAAANPIKLVIERQVVWRDAIHLIQKRRRRFDRWNALDGDDILQRAQLLGELLIKFAGARLLEVAIEVEANHARFGIGDFLQQDGKLRVVQRMAVLHEVLLGHATEDDVRVDGRLVRGAPAQEGVVDDQFRPLQEAVETQDQKYAKGQETDHRAAHQRISQRVAEGLHNQLPMMR